MIFKGLAALALAFSIGARAQDDVCDRFYTVGNGDTCDRIGRTEQAPSWQIIFENSDFVNPTCTNIFPGQHLCLGVAGRDCQKVTVVQAGDTCAFLADFWGMTVEDFMKINRRGVGDDCAIYVGQVLCTDISFTF